MKININKIIKVDKKLGGNLSRKGSLDFAINRAKHEEKNIFKAIAYIWRAILIDHPFSDGNKRTALHIAIEELEKNNIRCNLKKILRTIEKIVKKNIISIIKIERMLRKCQEK